ncbi:MAG: D-2-hydroxyacid dehydrogenase [Deltaproteobacteria bacterium]|nr:D-2-hydroxyacid dehydrogenase [Deltaproteobacteria bacterium]
MEHIVFLDRSTVDAQFRAPRVPHRWFDYSGSDPEVLSERLAGATMAITNKVRISASVLEAHASLRGIMVAATGVDHIDVGAAEARGIVVCNARGYASAAITEHVFMLILALRRNLLSYRQSVAQQAWSRAPGFSLPIHPIEDIEGATLGIVGYGATGRLLGERARALGLDVLVAEHKGRSATRPGRRPFEEVLAASDILSLHAPLTPETENLLGARELRLMKPTAIVINTARGGLIDESALDEALRAGRLAGAGLDVLREEPPARGNVLLAEPRLNLIVTPHVAWTSRVSKQRLAEQVIENIEALAAGAPIRVVSSRPSSPT